MPTRDRIAAEINSQKAAGQDNVRRKYLAALHKKTGRDTVVYFSSYNVHRPFPVPAAAVSVTQDDIQGFMARETLIKATRPGFFVREAATPKFASS